MMNTITNLIGSPYFHAACLAIVLVGCILAVLTHAFDDTIAQRAAFLVTALGAVLQLSLIVKVGYTSPGYGLMLAGAALYVTATVFKYATRWRRTRRGEHPKRRSTDFSAWQDTKPMPRPEPVAKPKPQQRAA